MNQSLPRVTVKIAGAVRTHTSNASSVSLQAGSVKQALDALNDADSELARQIFLPNGRLRGTVAIFVGAQDIRFGGGLDTPVYEGDEIELIFAIAGG